MRTTITIATNLNTNPFDVLNQDTDDVIMLINFYLMLGNEKETHEIQPSRKNDGFWDM